MKKSNENKHCRRSCTILISYCIQFTFYSVLLYNMQFTQNKIHQMLLCDLTELHKEQKHNSNSMIRLLILNKREEIKKSSSIFVIVKRQALYLVILDGSYTENNNTIISKETRHISTITTKNQIKHSKQKLLK